MATRDIYAIKEYIAIEEAADAIDITDVWGICYHVDGQGSANDDLATITGGLEGQIVILKADAVTITIKHNTGNIHLSSGVDFALTAEKQIILVCDALGDWCDTVIPVTDLYVTKALFDAQSVLAATADNTPAALVVAEQELVGRLTGGNVDGIAMGIADNNVVQMDSADAADNEYARFTAAGLEGRTRAEVLTDLLGTALTENDALILDPVLSADGKYNGIVRAGVAGATLAFGDLVYYAVGDGRWELADADQSSTCKGLLGICVLAAANDGDATTILLIGMVMAATFPAFTAGAPVYVSVTDGDVSSTAVSADGDIVRVVGQAWTADELWFNPSGDWFEFHA